MSTADIQGESMQYPFPHNRFRRTFHLPTTDDPHERKSIGQATASRRAEGYTVPLQKPQFTRPYACIACCSLLFSLMSLLSFPPVIRNLFEEKRKARLGIKPGTCGLPLSYPAGLWRNCQLQHNQPGVESGSLRVGDQYPSNPILATKYHCDPYPSFRNRDEEVMSLDIGLVLLRWWLDLGLFCHSHLEPKMIAGEPQESDLRFDEVHWSFDCISLI